jgi:hypothetical protein
MGGKNHLKLNIKGRPIENKYREGKVKSIQTWKSKALEIENKEANSSSDIG